MLYTSLLLAAAASAVTAFPTLTPAANVTAPVTISYFQGPVPFEGTSAMSFSGSCGTKVSSGTIGGGTCYDQHTLAIGIPQTNKDCKFTLYKGSHTCSAATPDVIDIPAGEGVMCINTGVLDGGMWYVASGSYSC